MRAMLIAMSSSMLIALGCGPGEAPLPKLTADQQAAVKRVTITKLQVSESVLEAAAKNGEAAVSVRLALGEPMPLFDRLVGAAMDMWEAERDGARQCQIRLDDRDGEFISDGASTAAMTETRPIEHFDADMAVAEGLMAQLSQNQQAWNLYRWEIRNLGRLAHELQGLKGPTQ